MDEFHFQTLLRELTGINTRLDRMNGRLNEAEQDLARLDERTLNSRSTAGKWGGGLGSLGGLVGGFLAGWMGGR